MLIPLLCVHILSRIWCGHFRIAFIILERWFGIDIETIVTKSNYSKKGNTLPSHILVKYIYPYKDMIW